MFKYMIGNANITLTCYKKCLNIYVYILGSKSSLSASLKNTRRSKSPRPLDAMKASTSKKTGNKLLKLFHN